MAACGLPEPVEYLHGRLKKVLFWMYAATSVAKEGPLQMNASRSSAPVAAPFDAVGNPVQRGERLIYRGRYSGRQIAGHSMVRQESPDYAHTILLHHVASRAAVNVQIKKPRGNNPIAQVDSICRFLSVRPRSNLHDKAVINQHQRLFNAFAWRNQRPGREGDHDFWKVKHSIEPRAKAWCCGGTVVI